MVSKIISGLNLQVDQTAVIRIVLEPGAITQQVEVTSYGAAGDWPTRMAVRVPLLAQKSITNFRASQSRFIRASFALHSRK